MFDIGGWEILMILLIALVAVPAKDFPKLVTSTARVIKKIRHTIDNWQQQLNFAIEKESESTHDDQQETDKKHHGKRKKDR